MSRDVRWTEESLDHIANHGVSKWEVEAALLSARRYSHRLGRLRLVIAKSDGRYLFILLKTGEGPSGLYEVVTARDATTSERALFFRRGKGSR